MTKDNNERTLTKAEMEIMNILWDKGEALTTHEIIDQYPEPKPAYSTIATFLKILTVNSHRISLSLSADMPAGQA